MPNPLEKTMLTVLLSITLTFSVAGTATAKSLRYGTVYLAKFENLLANQILLDEINKKGISRPLQLQLQDMELKWLRSLDRFRTHNPTNAKTLAEQVLQNQVSESNQELQTANNQGKSQAEMQEMAQAMKDKVNAQQALMIRLVQEIFSSGKLANALAKVASKNKIDVVLDRRGLLVSPKGKLDFAYDLNHDLAEDLNLSSQGFAIPESKPEPQDLRAGFYEGANASSDVQKLQAVGVPLANQRGINLLVDSRSILIGNKLYSGSNLTSEIVAAAPAGSESAATASSAPPPVEAAPSPSDTLKGDPNLPSRTAPAVTQSQATPQTNNAYRPQTSAPQASSVWQSSDAEPVGMPQYFATTNVNPNGGNNAVNAYAEAEMISTPNPNLFSVRGFHSLCACKGAFNVRMKLLRANCKSPFNDEMYPVECYYNSATRTFNCSGHGKSLVMSQVGARPKAISSYDWNLDFYTSIPMPAVPMN